MLILKSDGLTVQVIKKLKLAVFTWRGHTPSEAYQEGTIKSLEVLRNLSSINRIILDVRHHSVMLSADIDQSVRSTVDYLTIAKGNYRMAVLPPANLLAESTVNLYIDLLNKTLKKRFVVKKIATMRSALLWLTRPKFSRLLRGY